LFFGGIGGFSIGVAAVVRQQGRVGGIKFGPCPMLGRRQEMVKNGSPGLKWGKRVFGGIFVFCSLYAKKTAP
jgi:hypothetical protein